MPFAAKAPPRYATAPLELAGPLAHLCLFWNMAPAHQGLAHLYEPPPPASCLSCFHPHDRATLPIGFHLALPLGFALTLTRNPACSDRHTDNPTIGTARKTHSSECSKIPAILSYLNISFNNPPEFSATSSFSYPFSAANIISGRLVMYSTVGRRVPIWRRRRVERAAQASLRACNR